MKGKRRIRLGACSERKVHEVINLYCGNGEGRCRIGADCNGGMEYTIERDGLPTLRAYPMGGVYMLVRA